MSEPTPPRRPSTPSEELPRPPEGARSEDQVDDAAGDESPLSVVSVGEFVSDASTEPEMGESSHDAQEELGRAFEEQERRLER
ncbi:hypothetical protein FOZ63_015537, partial [Perkinsus olseni]